MRWIPVATLGPTSMPKAIEVLAAADKVAAFRRMEENHGKSWTAAAGIKSGIPRLSELREITGLTEQRNANPALEKFR